MQGYAGGVQVGGGRWGTGGTEGIGGETGGGTGGETSEW